ncbi:MAG: hypothetical protein Sylvanvirus39_2 [Sylvanvirus sp.]|uniref:F-box domain-containing protein n=1 Tax=Sylvanvirus sp. TaxID=2487774 RepID=A0A3G5AMH1_9VIRU|nr:MAG: hypothetical protein Sylvanvirus39_2 [Sylvanvirus sp.]
MSTSYTSYIKKVQRSNYLSPILLYTIFSYLRWHEDFVSCVRVNRKWHAWFLRKNGDVIWRHQHMNISVDQCSTPSQEQINDEDSYLYRTRVTNLEYKTDVFHRPDNDAPCLPKPPYMWIKHIHSLQMTWATQLNRSGDRFVEWKQLRVERTFWYILHRLLKVESLTFKEVDVDYILSHPTFKQILKNHFRTLKKLNIIQRRNNSPYVSFTDYDCSMFLDFARDGYFLYLQELTLICIKHGTGLSSFNIRKAILYCRQLKLLNFSHWGFRSSYEDNLAELGSLSSLTSLTLAHNTFYLELEHEYIPENIWFGNQLEKLPLLVHLDVSGNTPCVNISFITCISVHTPGLTSLSFGSHTFALDTIEWLACAFKKQLFPFLECLDLGEVNVESTSSEIEGGLTDLVSSFQYLTHLRILKWSVECEDSCFGFVNSHIVLPRTLESIFLFSEYGPRSSCFSTKLQGILNTLQRCQLPRLRHISLKEQTNLGTRQHLSKEDISSLATFLRAFKPRLQRLDLPLIEYKGFYSLRKYLETTVNSVYFGS